MSSQLRNAWFLLLSTITFSSNATLISNVSSSADASCSTSGNVVLNTIAKTSDNIAINQNTYESTTCGTYENNDRPNPDNSSNIGLRNDGFMNMDAAYLDGLNGGQIASGYSYTDFITEDDLQALGADSHNADANAFNDPGWIRLGEFDGDTESFEYAQIRDTALDSFFGGPLFDVNITGGNSTSGEWSLAVNGNAILEATTLLGRLTTFDHLAIILKGGTIGFAIYDFNFKDIFAQEAADGNDVFDFFTPYTFNGTWSTADLTGPGGQPQGLSHFSIWARDPIVTFNVSEPALMWLMLLSISVLLVRVQRRN